MFERCGDYETTALGVLAAAFEAAERLRPARALDRRRDLRLDVAAFAVLVAAGALSRQALLAVFAPLGRAEVPGLDLVRAWPGPARLVLTMVLADFSLYWIHRAMHASDVLWRTHEWHHSAENLYWLSGFRTSALHAFLFAVPQMLIPFSLLKLSPLEAGIGFSVGVFFQLWMHSNVRLPVGPLAWLLVTPESHRIHHSAAAERSKNLGISLTIWDRLFGTFMDPRSVPADLRLGLPYAKSPARMMAGV